MKRKIALLLSVFLTLSLCSCAGKGPDVPPETENNIIEISRGETEDEVNKLAASAVAYTDSFQSADGSVNVEINLEDASLYDGSFQTLQITPRPFTEEEVEHIARVLFADAVFYESNGRREATKSELRAQQEVLLAYLDSDAMEKYNEPGYQGLGTFDPAGAIRSFMERHPVEDAPESIERTVCDFQYKPWSDYHPGIGEVENYYQIAAQTEVDGIPYYFDAVNNTNAGIRVYHIGAYINEEIEWPLQLGTELYYDKLLSKAEPTQEQLDAVREKAEKLIGELNMGQWMIDSCEAVDMLQYWKIQVTAVPAINGIPMLRQPQLSSLRGEEEGTQNCYYPDLRMSFSANGDLLDFSLDTPVEISWESETESRVMSFSELMGSIKTQFSRYSAHQYTDQYCFGEEAPVEVMIDRIELGYDMLPVSQCPTEVLEYFGSPLWVNNSDFYLVPAVAVSGNFRTVPASEEAYAFDYRQKCGEDALFTILNAANGSTIAPENSGLVLSLLEFW